MPMFTLAFRLFTLLIVFFLFNACQTQKDGKNTTYVSKKDISETPMGDTAHESGDTSSFHHEKVEMPPIRRQWRRKLTKPFKWLKLAPGLDYAYAEAPIACNIWDAHFSILRADSSFYQATILSSKHSQKPKRTAREWAKDENFTAVINAGMYQMDHATNVGYMNAACSLNNSRFSKDKAFFATERKTSGKGIPSWQIIDRECQDWEQLIKQYCSVTQSIRMLNCDRNNVWGQQQKYWSMVAIGTDSQGRLLFLFCRSPYSVHDFIDMAKELPIDLQRCMYLEGGPEASFYVQTPDTSIGKMGSYETGFFESDDNSDFWSIPNVIGLRAKHNKP